MLSLISVRTSVRTFRYLPPSIRTFRSPSAFFPPLSYHGVSSVNHHLTLMGRLMKIVTENGWILKELEGVKKRNKNMVKWLKVIWGEVKEGREEVRSLRE